MATPQAPDRVPAQYLLSPHAAGPRTLIDVLYDTAACFPEAAAIDDGTVQLTYSELISDIEASVAWLAARGIGRGDRIGIRMPSGSFALYEAILATLATGAAYVPVDADDPDERAELVFGEANVAAIVTEAGMFRGPGSSRGWQAGAPQPRDDAWIIFTSGSTGTPKGVAVTHRSAAAFVDAEAQIFLRDNPIGPGDRVLAGLSVAFDASCEEMWLAWRHGACLVPAPRSLVRSGMDLGPWLVSRDVTVVSTVPTLAALWPAEALEAVRLLIFGGESCPPELAARLAVDGREVWNTYGPTEATVVACAAQLNADGPVRIGLPLPGWDLAVVDERRQAGCRWAKSGELVIGGVGLARYLDPDKDAEKYAPMPTLGWSRAYRSGDLVRLESEGLYLLRPRRRPGQGRWPPHRARRGGLRAGATCRASAAALPRFGGRPAALPCWSATSPAPTPTSTWPPPAPRSPSSCPQRWCRDWFWSTSCRPARRARSTAMRCRGRPGWRRHRAGADLGGTTGWLAGLWRDVLGRAGRRPGGRLLRPRRRLAVRGAIGRRAARALPAGDRRRPLRPSAARIARRLSSTSSRRHRTSSSRLVKPTPRLTQLAQILLSVPLATLTGTAVGAWLALCNNVARARIWCRGRSPVNWWLVAAASSSSSPRWAA